MATCEQPLQKRTVASLICPGGVLRHATGMLSHLPTRLLCFLKSESKMYKIERKKKKKKKSFNSRKSCIFLRRKYGGEAEGAQWPPGGALLTFISQRPQHWGRQSRSEMLCGAFNGSCSPPCLQTAASFHSVCLMSDWLSPNAPACGFRSKNYIVRLSEAFAFDRVDAAWWCRY